MFQSILRQFNVACQIRGTSAKIYKFCVKQKSLSENDSENEIKIG